MTSKARQQKAVGEGLAIGCLSLGYTELPSNKMNVEFAFRVAWRSWDYARQFPTVKTGPAQDDIYYAIMGRSQRRRGPRLAYWEIGRTLSPMLEDGYDLESAEELLVSFYGIPLEGWQELARVFGNDLGAVDAP